MRPVEYRLHHAAPGAFSASIGAMSEIHALAAREANAKLEPFTYDPGPLGDEQIEIDVLFCGICHSDVAMLSNEWGMATFPLCQDTKRWAVYPRWEPMRRGSPRSACGPGLELRKLSSLPAMPLRRPQYCVNLEQTIVGRHGAFGTKVRCHWTWAVPLPEGVDAASAGPLFCGGITVFNPMLQENVLPTDRVAVIGIGGLGPMALQFMNKWGCDVTAFTSSEAKGEEAKKMGAHRIIDTHSAKACARRGGRSISFFPPSQPISTGRVICPPLLRKESCMWWVFLRNRSRFPR